MVRHVDLTGEEEYAIVSAEEIIDVLRSLGLLTLRELKKAVSDIKQAYENKAANLLLVRRVQLDSPNLYWLAFYSENKVLGTDMFFNVQGLERNIGKILAIYLNSVIALLQLLAFLTEIRASWVDLHGNHVWGQVHIPDVREIDERLVCEAVNLFEKIGKVNVRSLYQRIRLHDNIQRMIDEFSLKMLNLEEWKERLNEIYDIVSKELEIMRRVLKGGS